ncbi:DNA methylase N-4/N-6 domain protein [Catenulispora acidiphila DSM 44928]|uniref:Methyltransferase n=1 Tax=Catenulispora acidiphila (strain DSM 44928 / JCM 14897 / NBRC 102108 / NRRL B-24433 / ID139908) TaxID=479433 RepID=C7Q8H3_CATAD|nr:site-specific DNA-methyltransferase [Catenulispora acidiphila]ACU76161.1 DNA methylase N-4/N-6 domain protein [Catenulispora acidiphila DSM 44928]
MNQITPTNRNRILVGDVRARLSELPDAAVHCVITSPPYWSLRDYGHPDQIGAEPTVQAWAETIAAVCGDLGRVLRPDGVLWLNLGDGYSRHIREGAAKKCLLLGPERVALKMTQSGWLLRNKVIWAKRNPMPANVRDRLSTSHEYLYCFTRSPQYYFDLDAIREPAVTANKQQRAGNRATYPPRTAVPSLNGGSTSRVDLNHGLSAMKARGVQSHPLGKNPGDVWSISTASYHGAHFATFPVELVRRPLLATCPERTCAACGTPWARTLLGTGHRRASSGPLRQACLCQAGWQPGLVLDPFIGAGTVGVAAERFGRDWLGIELNPDFAALATARIAEARAAKTNR